MHLSMGTTEIFLIAMLIIFTVPYLIWRLADTDYYAPLVVVQILTGVLLGPGILGRAYPEYYQFVFNPDVIKSLNGIAWWAVMLFVMIAGIELDLKKAWEHRRESAIAASLALVVPLVFGCIAALGMLGYAGWMGPKAQSWQFVLGVGMACAVTSLPILILLLEIASVSGKLLGLHFAGKILKWGEGEASIIGWLLQTKALIGIIFVNILLDKGIVTSETFTALLLMAIGSTMLTTPVVYPKLRRLAALVWKTS